jgi:hypothetical protein
MRKQPNYTCMLKNLLKLYCIWTSDTLWVFYFFVLFCTVLFYFIFPLWWDNYRTKSEAPSPGLEAEGWTPKLLRLKLHCIWTWRFFLFNLFHILFYVLHIFFFHLLIFYIYSYLHSFYFLFSILCLSNAYSAYSWLVQSLPPYIFESFFVSLFCFFLLVYLFFPFPLTTLLSIPSHPLILNTTSAIITARNT